MVLAPRQSDRYVASKRFCFGQTFQALGYGWKVWPFIQVNRIGVVRAEQVVYSLALADAVLDGRGWGGVMWLGWVVVCYAIAKFPTPTSPRNGRTHNSGSLA